MTRYTIRQPNGTYASMGEGTYIINRLVVGLGKLIWFILVALWALAVLTASGIHTLYQKIRK